MHYLRAIFALILAFSSVAVYSQALPVPRVAFPLSTVGNIGTVGAVTADAANAAKFSFGVAANGAVFANSGASLPTAGGKSIPLSVVGTVPKAAVGAALARFVGRALPLLNTASALYQLGEELGYRLDNSSGQIAVSRPVTTTTPGTPASVFTGLNSPYPTTAGNWADETTACAGVGTPSLQFASSGGGYCTMTAGPSPGNGYALIRNPSPTPAVPGTSTISLSPSSQQEFIDAVASRSGWPSTSALAQTMVDALHAGEALQVEPVSVTGPASSTVSSTVTNNPSTNTNTTVNTVNNYAYAGNTVAVTTTTTVVATDATTGAVTATSTTGTTPTIPDPIITCGLPDTPPCKIDESGTPGPVAADVYKSKLDDYKSKQAELADKAAGASDKTFFSGWGSVFVTPPLAACAGYVLPRDMGTLDPCPVVDGVRTIMAYIWALTALFLAVGMVKKVV